ncbi:glycerate kinase [Oceanobacillus alkalisoli]|uniref:glycerate kinase n=1 Tax=Oceanobacillus alkalisoli TaxID=2925113 RepID=UPI001F120715|nr:glycerate kinase [Oceanobacillus alkalisoli]MCF3942569.1 glycerate kinase [Oceanobacillus alkalisoli]
MKIVMAPDSFKESMTAKQAAEAIKLGFRSVFGESLDIDIIPMADGGEGTIESLMDALHGSLYEKVVTGPLGEKVRATYALSGDQSLAVIEMAEASGLALVPAEKRNPLITTTYGTGELIKDALDHGVKKIILGIGGSATNDGGAGMIEALGGEFIYRDSQSSNRGGGTLVDLIDINLANFDSRIEQTEIIVACDVDNPLLGKHGASAVYGPQKGATEEMVEQLDKGLANYHNVLARVTGRDVKDIPGAGAAGGLGAGLLHCFDALLEKGVEIVLKETDFYKRVTGADLVITGEGKIDAQSIYGKTPVGVAQAAKSQGVKKVIAFCGTLGKDYELIYEAGIDAVFSITEGSCALDEALAKGPENLESTARNVARLLAWT